MLKKEDENMKIGVRKPSIKKSFSARTTGRVKRAAKHSVNPLYGKKGMGWINNPQKAAYNKIYNKTTVSVNNIIKDSISYTNSSIDNIQDSNGMGLGEFIVTIFQLIFGILQIVFYGALLFGLLYFVFVIIF